MAILGNLMSGIQTIDIAIALTIIGQHFQRLDILHGWHPFLRNLINHPTHVVVDLGCTLSIGSRAAIRRFQKYALHYALPQSFVPARNPLCWQTVRWRLAGKVVLFIFQRNLHDQPVLMCLKQMYVFYSHFRKWKIGE